MIWSVLSAITRARPPSASAARVTNSNSGVLACACIPIASGAAITPASKRTTTRVSIGIILLECGTLRLQLFREPLAFCAHFVDELRVGSELLSQSDGPRSRIRLRIVHCHLDLEMAEVGPANALAELGRPRDHAAIPVDPDVVAKSDRVDHQRIVGPHGRRVSLPGWIRVWRQRAAIREDLAVYAVVLVQHDQQVRRLDELEVMGQPVRTREGIGKAADMRVVDGLVRRSLIDQSGEPRLIRQ